MSVVRSYVETSISFPISSTTILTGRINPRTTLVCLEQPTLASSKNRFNLNRINLNLTAATTSPYFKCFTTKLGRLSVYSPSTGMTKSLSNADFPDSINIENVIFDEQKNERSSFEAKLCCLEKTTCNIVFFHFDTPLFHHFCGCFVQYWFLDLQF